MDEKCTYKFPYILYILFLSCAAILELRSSARALIRTQAILTKRAAKRKKTHIKYIKQETHNVCKYSGEEKKRRNRRRTHQQGSACIHILQIMNTNCDRDLEFCARFN